MRTGTKGKILSDQDIIAIRYPVANLLRESGRPPRAHGRFPTSASRAPGAGVFVFARVSPGAARPFGLIRPTPTAAWSVPAKAGDAPWRNPDKEAIFTAASK